MNLFSDEEKTNEIIELNIVGDVTMEELLNPDSIPSWYCAENSYMHDSNLSAAFQTVKDKFTEKLFEKGVKKC
ncbi:MAG: hypothetical protein LBR68_01155 [Lachnoclostridium sp.]|jgi:hypothetical protein|nr:hypothetical protein [Lachnoclostridium sp.]